MKHQSYIRSLFVALCAFFVCASALAETVHLNPFAYRLDDMTAKSGANLSNDYFEVKYSLSGPAASVIIRLWDISDNASPKSAWSRDGGNTGTCLAEFPLTGSYLQKGAHTYRIDFTDVIGQGTSLHGKKVRWTIDVMGGNQKGETSVSESIQEVTAITYENPLTNHYEYDNGGSSNDKLHKTSRTISYTRIEAEPVSESYSFEYPGGVDICNDPYNYNFGVIWCTESKTGGQFNKRGLYAFGGGMEHLKGRWTDDGVIKEAICYSGPGFSDGEKFSDSRMNLGPHRVRIASDGRVYVTALTNANKILYKVAQPLNEDNNNFYECPTTGGLWSSIFTSGTWDATTATLKTGSNFIAGANVAFDVAGTGSALKLLLLSSNKEGVVDVKQSSFRIDQYPIGTADTWTSASTYNGVNNLLYTGSTSAAYSEKSHNHVITKIHDRAEAMLVGYDNVGIEYDPQGGFWMAQLRLSPAGPLAATLVHRTKKGVWEHEEHVMNRGKGGIRHNHNHTKLAVAGGVITDTIMHMVDPAGEPLHASYYNKGTAGKKYQANELGTNGRAYKSQTARKNQITIYDVSYDSNGKATLSNPKYINTGTLSSIKDIAWDFADNLYVSDPIAEKFVAFALPHKDKEVSTPCMEKFNFTLSPVYNFGVKVNPTVSGADTYATIKHARIGKAPYPNYLHNANINLVAEEILDGCKFYQWSGYVNTATENGNQLTISSLAKSDPDVTAEIGICVYEEEAPLAVQVETTFPAAFVKRELDNISYSTICLPFNLTTLEGTPYVGASVLKFDEAEDSDVAGDNRTFLTFKEVTFTNGDIMEAGKPYLIKLETAIASGVEKIFKNVTCPPIGPQGQSVTHNGVTFHALLNPTTFKAAQLKDMLFLTADNRLVTLYGHNSVNINGLRGYFTVSGGMAKTAEFVLNLPDKVVTSTPMVNMADSLQVTKYLWDGKIYIQKGNQVYDLSGMRVR